MGELTNNNACHAFVSQDPIMCHTIFKYYSNNNTIGSSRRRNRGKRKRRWSTSGTIDGRMAYYISTIFLAIKTAIIQEDICKPVVCLMSCRFPFPCDMPFFCISGFLSSNIPPSSSLAWMKDFPKIHLMSKYSYNNTTKMAQLRMPFSLSRQRYQVLPPLRIHCTPY